ncbi:MAG TPA: hypothetical protein VEC16_04705, partial [Alphaproteobacteria bacterium]|nr:hypothetical protein [Alphaproteobacteria bacterium]
MPSNNRSSTISISNENLVSSLISVKNYPEEETKIFSDIVSILSSKNFASIDKSNLEKLFSLFISESNSFSAQLVKTSSGMENAIYQDFSELKSLLDAIGLQKIPKDLAMLEKNIISDFLNSQKIVLENQKRVLAGKSIKHYFFKSFKEDSSLFNKIISESAEIISDNSKTKLKEILSKMASIKGSGLSIHSLSLEISSLLKSYDSNLNKMSDVCSNIIILEQRRVSQLETMIRLTKEVYANEKIISSLNSVVYSIKQNLNKEIMGR